MPAQKRPPAKRVQRTNVKSNSTGLLSKLKFGSAKTRWLVLVAVFVAVGVKILTSSFAATNLWLPTADKPLTLAWILGGAVDGSNIPGIQTKNLIGGPVTSGQTPPTADVYDIDGEMNSAATVALLHAAGKKVICYFDAGVYEDYRTDAKSFPSSVIGGQDPGWNGSNWLDVRQISILQPIMQARIAMCKSKGFDAVEPDEINGWNADGGNGFGFTWNDQIAYNKAIASWVHAAGMSVALKDDPEQAPALVNDFDFFINEECFAFDECVTITPEGPGAPKGDVTTVPTFTMTNNKAAWITEYPDGDLGNQATGTQDYSASQQDKKQPSHLTAALTKTICDTAGKYKMNTAFYISGLPVNGGRTDCNYSTWGGASVPTGGGTGGGGTTTPVTPVVSASATTPTASNTSFTITGTSNIAGTIVIAAQGATTSLKTCTAIAANTACSVVVSGKQAGTYVYQVTATNTNDGGTANKSVSVIVPTIPNPTPNVAPTITSISATPSTVVEGNSVVINVNATDSDGQVSKVTINYSGPQSGSIGASGGPTSFSQGFRSLTVGTYEYSAVATDNGGLNSAAKSIKVVVTAAPATTLNPPTIHKGVAFTDPDAVSRDNIFGCSWNNHCALKLSWSTVSNASTYEVSRGTTVLGTTANNYFWVTPINQDAVYGLSVRSVNGPVKSNPALTNKKVQCFLFWCGGVDN